MRLAAILTLLISSLPAPAQTARWELQSPGTTNWQINDIAFTSLDHGFYCANNKELWETNDRGRTWINRIRFSGFGVDGEQIVSVAFFDAQRGFLVSNGEAPASYTGDGGQTWQPAGGALPYGRKFLDIISPTRAFLGGSQFSTTNAGASWSMHPWPVNLGRMFSFDMRDDQVGLMASETYNPPIIAGTYRTIDGGQTWTRFADFGRVLWLDQNTALNARPHLDHPGPLPSVLGAAIDRSTDAGQTWSLIADNIAPGSPDQQQGFWDWCTIDATTIVGVSLSGKAWRSADAGLNWTLTQPTDLIRGPVPDTAMGIRAFGQQVWIFAEKGIAMRSDDGGITWAFPASGVGLDISEISMRDDLVGLAAAKGFILRTTDGGQFWAPTRLNVEGIIDPSLPVGVDLIEDYSNIAWQDANTVYLSGVASSCCSGRFIMWKSSDAGLTWQYVYGLADHVRVTAFDCEEYIWTDPLNGYLLGFDVDPAFAGPSGYKTTDGGQTWMWMTSLLQSAVYGADFVDASNGWIQFAQTDTAYTTNGGASWSVVHVPGSGLNDFDMVDLSTGFAVGVLGETYKTANGGRSWLPLPAMNSAEDYYEVKALSASEAVLVGRDNSDPTHFRFFIRRTTDGGQAWTREDLPDEWNTRLLHAYRLDARPGRKTWVVGWGGLIGRSAPPSLCYANCDGSSATPILTANDFLCFLNKFAAAHPSANCDGVGGLTANDFVCFISAYAAGCP